MWSCNQSDVGLTPSSVLSQLCGLGEVMASLGLKLLLYKIGISRGTITVPRLWGCCEKLHPTVQSYVVQCLAYMESAQ